MSADEQMLGAPGLTAGVDLDRDVFMGPNLPLQDRCHTMSLLGVAVSTAVDPSRWLQASAGS